MNILGIVLTKDQKKSHILKFKIKIDTPDINYGKFLFVKKDSLSFYDDRTENFYPVFSEFWGLQNYTVFYECEDFNLETSVQNGTEKNLTSISLAAFLAPITQKRDYNFSFTHVCFTGLVKLQEENGINEPIVDTVTQIEEKYSEFSKYVNSLKISNEKFAFVYVSDKKINPKNENPKIKSLHITPYTTIEELLDKLSFGFRRPVAKFYQFSNSVYSKLSQILTEKQKFNTIEATIYLSGNKYSEIFLDSKWFDIFRRAIDLDYKLSINIYITKFLSNNELTSDDMNDELLPKWWKGSISNSELIEKNEKLKRLDLFIRNQIEILKRYIYETYGYKKTDKFRFSINYCDNNNITNQTENALILDIGDKKYITHTSADYFEYSNFEDNAPLPEEILTLKKQMVPEKKTTNTKFINKKDSQKILKVIDSTEFTIDEKKSKISEILVSLKKKNIYLPYFTLYGLPGSGKTTLIKKIASLYTTPEKPINDIHIISSDFIINDQVFDDSNSSHYNPNNTNNQSREHVIYSRNDYERFLVDGHDMDIRNLAVEIAIRQCAVTHDMLDLGGKELLIEQTNFLLHSLGFLTVFICPDGAPTQNTITFADDEEKLSTDNLSYFEAYYKFYVDNHSLFDKSKRRNIFKLGEPFKFYKNLKGEILDLEPENWESFKKNLYKKIFMPRFYFYNRKYDIKILRRGTEDEMVLQVLKGILKVHLERLSK